jgi:exodeoxyribonuclease-3
MPRVQAWLEETQPDVLCMQETKMKQDVFPTDVFTEMGYQSAHFGQGQWNGVAILSKVGLTDVVQNFATGEPDADARIISATCDGAKVVCVYVPNGRDLENEHYQYKLRWLKQLCEHVDIIATPADDVIVTGDFNIAPLDIDVWATMQMKGVTHVSEPERKVLGELRTWGLVDIFREQNPGPDLYSWWDYRDGSFHKGHGMRIDFQLVSKSIAQRTKESFIDRNARKGEKPSDHAPVLIRF